LLPDGLPFTSRNVTSLMPSGSATSTVVRWGPPAVRSNFCVNSGGAGAAEVEMVESCEGCERSTGATLSVQALTLSSTLSREQSFGFLMEIGTRRV
jgi:hypothetical protein